MKKLVSVLVWIAMVFPLVGSAELPPVMVTVEIRGLDAMAEQVGLLASDVGMPMTKDDLLQMVGGFMMAPGFEGLAKDGTIRLMVMDPQAAQGGSGEPPVLISLPVAGDGTEYLEAVSMFMKPGETADGVTEYAADPASPGPLPMQSVFVSKLDGQLLVGAQRDLVRDGAAAIQNGTLPSANLPVSGTVALSVPCRRNADKLEPLVEQMTQAASAAPSPIDAGRILQAEFKGLIRLLRQTENVMIGLKADGNAVTLSSLIEPAAGSVLQRVIGELRPPSAAVSSVIPVNALLAASGFFVLPDEFLEAYAEMTDEMYGAMGAPFADLAPAMREAIEGIKGQFAGDYAMGILPGAGDLPVDIIQVAAVRDVQQVKAAVEKVVAAVQKITAAIADQAAGQTPEGGESESAKPPFSIKLEQGEARTYQGVEVTPYQYKMELPEEAKSEMPEAIAKWFTEMKYELAYVDNYAVYTFGSSKAMDTAVDAIKGGAGRSMRQAAPVQSLLPDLPAAATDVSWINILDIVRTVMKAIPDIPAEMADGLPATSVSLAGFSVAEGGNLASHMRLARSDIAALTKYFQSMAQSAAPSAGAGEESWDPSMVEDSGLETIEEDATGEIPGDAEIQEEPLEVEME